MACPAGLCSLSLAAPVSVRHEIQQPHSTQSCPLHQSLWLVPCLDVFAPNGSVFAGL